MQRKAGAAERLLRKDRADTAMFSLPSLSLCSLPVTPLHTDGTGRTCIFVSRLPSNQGRNYRPQLEVATTPFSTRGTSGPCPKSLSASLQHIGYSSQEEMREKHLNKKHPVFAITSVSQTKSQGLRTRVTPCDLAVEMPLG